MTLFLGLCLDALIGEPRWLWSRLPHPAVLMGRLIAACDARWNTGDSRRLSGALVMAALVAGAGAAGWLISSALGAIAEVIVLAVLIAQRSLVSHVQAVGDALRLSMGDGRRAVAMIVGRDTAEMAAPDVARAAVESAAENLSDGVIAPVFWFALAGLPGLLVYKITNTADSMIGYLTPRHADFGWAAARFDDLLNLIPARITALMIWAVTGRPAPAPIRQDAALHRSPNAGWPEAAMAHGLGIALSGPRSYQGARSDDPFVNPAGAHDIGPDEIDAATGVLWRVWWLALSLALLGWCVAGL